MEADGNAGGSSDMAGGGGAGGSNDMTGTGGGGSGGIYDFPSASTIYQDVSNAPLDSESSTIISTLQTMGWDAGRRIALDPSFSVLVADATISPRAFMPSSKLGNDCDTAPIPIPLGGHIEGNSGYACNNKGDCHLLVYQGRRLYELYHASISGGMATGGTFTGDCLAIWDLTRDYWVVNANPYSRGEYCNGADAADMPLTALILKKDELMAGQVNHALRFTIPNDHIRAGVYVHPATHIGGPTGGGNLPPYGARFRLKSNFDVTKLPSAAAQTIGRTLQKYGMFLSDGGSIFISATDDIAAAIKPSDIGSLQPQDFEVVDGGARITWAGGTCPHVPITQ